MADIILRQGDIDRFNSVLSQLVAKAHITLSVLIHKDGHLLAFSGSTIVDTTSLAALVSANFAATIAVANLLGEKEFPTQLHKGNTRCIFISLVDDNTFLASIFDNSVPIETVRVYTEEYSNQLKGHLTTFYANSAAPQAMDLSGLPLDETIQIPMEELNMFTDQHLQPAVKPRRLEHTVAHSPQPVAPVPQAAAPVPPAAAVEIKEKPDEPARTLSISKDKPSVKKAPSSQIFSVNPLYLKKKVHEFKMFEKNKKK